MWQRYQVRKCYLKKNGTDKLAPRVIKHIKFVKKKKNPWGKVKQSAIKRVPVKPFTMWKGTKPRGSESSSRVSLASGVTFSSCLCLALPICEMALIAGLVLSFSAETTGQEPSPGGTWYLSKGSGHSYLKHLCIDILSTSIFTAKLIGHEAILL